LESAAVGAVLRKVLPQWGQVWASGFLLEQSLALDCRWVGEWCEQE